MTYCAKPMLCHQGTADKYVYSESVKDAVIKVLDQTYILVGKLPGKETTPDENTLLPIHSSLRRIKARESRKKSYRWPPVQGIDLMSFFRHQGRVTVNVRTEGNNRP